MIFDKLLGQVPHPLEVNLASVSANVATRVPCYWDLGSRPALLGEAPVPHPARVGYGCPAGSTSPPGTRGVSVSSAMISIPRL